MLLAPTWSYLLNMDRTDTYFKQLIHAVEYDSEQYEVYPSRAKVFRALNWCDYHDTKVVILGQDPYHSPGQATGLSFAVPKYYNPKPPSLVNIMKEAGITEYDSGLEGWAKQGVLLLNSVLTVRKNQPGSHAGLGWEKLTDHMIMLLNEKPTPVVFMLWGNFAKSKLSLITDPKHKVLTATHPSPLSVSGFFGCGHFNKANEFLKSTNQTPIDWTKTSAVKFLEIDSD